MSNGRAGTRLNTDALQWSGFLRRAGEALGRQDGYFRTVLDALPTAVYITDAAGLITYYNDAAADLWGHRPQLGKAQWCGSWKLYWPDGRLLPHDQCPMAMALREGRPVRGIEAVAERPDGVRVPFIPYPTPFYDDSGALIGAVNMLVDITNRKRAEEQQKLLLREMNHRVRNVFAVASAVVTLSANSANTSEELASAIRERLGALARADDLTLPKASDAPPGTEHATTLHALIQKMVSPFDGRADGDGGARVVVSGPDIPITGSVLTSFALLLHEFATNAAKYGALSTSAGHVDVECSEVDDQFVLVWTERGGPPVQHETEEADGFGSLLARATIRGQLRGEFSRDWNPEGLTIRFSVDRDRLIA